LYAALVLILAGMLFLPAIAFAQSQQYVIVKSERNEMFAFPFSAANRERSSPLVYTYDEPKGPTWIVSVTNNLTYVPDDNSKTIIRLQEPAPSEKFIEIAMHGGEAMKFWIAVNIPGTGYAQLYSKNSSGWSTESAIVISHVSTSGLSVTDGKRIILDRFDLDGFTVGSIAVYGRDDADSPANTLAGNISFDILFGNFEESPLYLVPAVVTAGVGGIIAVLLVIKKRKPSD
jgi:hypothetical protein